MRFERVFITPLIKQDTYGSEVDVTGYVNIDGLSKIKRSIDSTDYSVGVYTFNDLRLKAQNATGIFNENDSRSIFPFTRDKAKVRVESVDIDQKTKTIISQIQFEGLLNDEATRINITTDEIRFAILSKDSVLRTTQIPAGAIPNGTDVKAALETILLQIPITNVLNVNVDNIQPDLNYIIDLGSELDNLEIKNALNLILPSSNSVLIIDPSDNIIIRNRDNSDKEELLNLKGRGNISNESNITSISDYNTGRQRQFNSIILNGSFTVQDTDHIFEFGLKQASLDLPFITTEATLQSIGQRFIDEFKFPKIELKLRIPTPISEGFDLLDTARVDAPWLKKRKSGEFFPVLGVTVLGDTNAPLPLILGSTQIGENLKFKIISMEDDPKNFITVLKLRQSGVSSNDGVFDEATFAILDEAILGVAILGKG